MPLKGREAGLGLAAGGGGARGGSGEGVDLPVPVTLANAAAAAAAASWLTNPLDLAKLRLQVCLPPPPPPPRFNSFLLFFVDVEKINLKPDRACCKDFAVSDMSVFFFNV